MAAPRMTADTSVVIPVVASWHEAHSRAGAAAAEVRSLPGHVLLEAVATLTRLPRGLAASTADAITAVRHRFDESPIALAAADYEELVRTIERAGLRGGQVYDALVASTAKSADAVLLTRDRRAAPAYRAVGVEVRFVA